MKQTKITAVGEEAVASNEPLIILFDETATDEIKKVAIIHEKNDEESYTLAIGSTITLGEQVYEVVELGDMVNHSLELMGHATLMFKENEEEAPLASSIYLRPYVLPNISVGMTIKFN